MDEESILNKLVKAKDCIRRKFKALKTGETKVEKLISQTFKPIIDPLNKISNTSHSSFIPPSPPPPLPSHLPPPSQKIEKYNTIQSYIYIWQILLNIFLKK